MKVILEDEDYIKAITPSWAGCSFRLIIDECGAYLTHGCGLVGPSESNHYIYTLIKKNGDKPIKIDITPELEHRLLTEVEQCSCCGGTLFKPRW